MNFQTKDKIKRIKIAKDLFTKGFTKERLADYFDVSIDTVDGYLKYDIMHDGKREIIVKKRIPITTLSDFATTTTTMDKMLPQIEKEGDKCKLCGAYSKFEHMIKWNSKTRICKHCYATMNKDKMNKLNSLIKEDK